MAISGEPLGSTLAALDAATRELLARTSPIEVSADSIGLLGLLDWRYGPKSGGPRRPVVPVRDNGSVHTIKASTAALAARPWIIAEWLPAYTPELNRIERTWRDLADKTFKIPGDLEGAVRAGIKKLNQERHIPYQCDGLK